jgi:hypothetical protein
MYEMYDYFTISYRPLDGTVWADWGARFTWRDEAYFYADGLPARYPSMTFVVEGHSYKENDDG